MSFTSVFGGGVLAPSSVSYRAITLSADLTLYWPTSFQTTSDVVCSIMDVTPTGAYVITMPDATEVSNGTATLIRNFGASTVTVNKSDGTTLTTISTGVSSYIYLTDNSTAGGTWETVFFGVGTASPVAASLASQSVIASGTTLNSALPVTSINSDYTALAGDRGTTFVWGGGSGTLSFTTATTLGNNWFCLVRNAGSGALVLDPDGSETIDGNSTVTINQNESCFVICTGTEFYTVGQGRTVTFSYNRLVLSVAGNTDVTLTSAQYANQIQEFTGTLTGNINVIEPTNVNVYYIYNNTNGAYTLTVKTAAGTGIVVTQGARTILYCDGTNIVNATTISAGTVTSVATSADLTGGPITTTGTLGLSTTGVTAAAYKVGNFTVDAKGRLTLAGSASPGSATIGNLVLWNATTADLFSDAGFAASDINRLSQSQTVSGVKTHTAATRGTPSSVSYSASLTLDFSAANNFEIGALTGNITINNPSNLTAGQSGVITLVQDGTGGRTVSWGSYFKFASGTAPTLTTTASAVNEICYYVRSSTFIVVTAVAGVA